MSFVENWGTILNESPRVFDGTNLKDSVGEMGKSQLNIYGIGLGRFLAV
jgi:hypothetical protein